MYKTKEEFEAYNMDKKDFKEGGFKSFYYFTDMLLEVPEIELTEEWLFKLQFDLLHRGKYRSVFDYALDSRFGYTNNHGLIYIDSVITFVGNTFSHIQYVHQVLNLYFALTGSELTIKEDK